MLGGLTALVVIVLSLPWLAGALLMNLANVTLMKMPLCPTEQLTCQSSFASPTLFSGNQADLEKAATWLREAVSLAPQLTHAERSLTVVEFALNDRPAATRAFAAAKRHGADGPVVQWDFMNHLLEARLAAEDGERQTAVTDFRLGLISGATRTLPVDEQAFLLAVAGLYQQAAEADQDVPRSAYLTGKYLVRAGEWAAGERWLSQAIDNTSVAPLAKSDEAAAHLFYGVALEQTGAPIEAAAHYEAAIRANPDRAEAYARLVDLSRRLGRPLPRAVAAGLDRLDPSYIVGRQGTSRDSRRPEAADLGSGWRLIGYDVDEESLAAGPPIDVLLWWDTPPGTTPDDGGWVAAGSHWLQWQHVTNLAPNASFTWGSAHDGLPLGFSYEFYRAAPRSFATLAADRAGHPSTVLELRNERSRRVGLVATPVPVDADAVYLQAGWKRDPAQTANIGRLCTINPQLDVPVYIAYPKQGDPPTEWVHFAAVSPPVPDQHTNRCSLFLMNYESDSSAQFSDTLFVRVDKPHTRSRTPS